MGFGTKKKPAPEAPAVDAKPGLPRKRVALAVALQKEGSEWKAYLLQDAEGELVGYSRPGERAIITGQAICALEDAARGVPTHLEMIATRDAGHKIEARRRDLSPAEQADAAAREMSRLERERASTPTEEDMKQNAANEAAKAAARAERELADG